MLQKRRYQQKGVGSIPKDLLGNIFSALIFGNREIVHRRFISRLGHHRAAVYKSPCAVGIVLLCKLLSYSVLFKNESCFKLRLLRIFGNAHSLHQVGTDMIRAEVKHRQTVDTPSGEYPDKEDGIHRNHPLITLRNETVQQAGITAYTHCGQQQNHVLVESFPIRQFKCVAKATAVRHRIGQSQIKRKRSHQGHQDQQSPCRCPAPDTEKQINTQTELHDSQQNSCRQIKISGYPVCQMKGFGIIFKLVLRSSRVDRFDKARQDKRTGQNQTTKINPAPFDFSL